MYPGHFVENWYDLTEQQEVVTIPAVSNAPLFMLVGSFDKGTEELGEYEGAAFKNMFGAPSFVRHGQNSIQAQNIIDHGGRLLVKRVCAADATLANVVFVATLGTIESQKVNSNGEPIYLDESGEETTEVTENPVMVNNTSIKWEATSITGCKTFDEVKKAAEALNDETAGKFALILFTDNGRGNSSKAIRINPDYSTSKGIGKVFYSMEVYEGTSKTEAVAATFDPSVIYNNESYGLNKESMVQVSGIVIEENYDAYVAALAEKLDKTVEEVRNYDLIYGYDSKGSLVEGLTMDAEGIDMSTSYGVVLKEGSNGAFGANPVNSEAWVKAICDVYAGNVTDEIYDVDQHKIAAIVDANFPVEIKEEIAKFVNFRKDCMFFRDLGTGNNTFLKIQESLEKNTVFSRFITDNGTSFQIKDPVTKRIIEVTANYDIAGCLVDHIANGPHNPLAGTVNGFILPSAIKGTINFTPIITPVVNQKQAMEDIRVNYAIFENDNCVVQTSRTAQDMNSQLSYINNVLAIQAVLRAVRTACPKSRYSLITGQDLSFYAKTVNNVLSNFRSFFDKLEFTYTQDSLKVNEKIFHCSLKFAFKDWIQTELVDVYAINNN